MKRSELTKVPQPAGLRNEEEVRPATPIAIEPERYEFSAVSPYRFELDRREFLGLLGGGILVLVAVRDLEGQRQRGDDVPQELGAWLHIAEDGAVTAYTGKVEIGQNIRTSLTQAVADELRVKPADIRLVMGDTALVPFDMGTFGSRTTPFMAPQLRHAAGTARELLIRMAAERWKTDAANLQAQEGKVRNPANCESFTYGELTRGQKLVASIGTNPETLPREQWKLAGTSMPKVDGREFVTGKHRYTSDVRREGMLYGRVLRAGAVKSDLASSETSAAEKMPGVVVVRDGNFVGVAAPTERQAERAIAAVKAEWKTPPQPSHENVFAHLKQKAESARVVHSAGAAQETIQSAERKVRQEYTVAYIAHAPLEPRAAVAEWEGEKLTVWTGTQRPFGVKSELAEAFRLSPENVRVIVPDTGSAYGGKHSGETAIEAARLARAAGKPVQVVWTREEEFMWAYFRPAGVIEVASAYAPDGKLQAWLHRNYNSGAAGIRTMYDIANQQIEFVPSDSPLRQGSYRGLAAVANHFAREVHMDEVAQALKLDPLEFRLRNLSDARLRAVLEAAAEKFGWGKQPATKTRGFGIAGGFDKGSYIATCAEVGIEAGGRVRLRRLVAAYECGAIVNPDGVRNQVEGSLVQGIGGALFEQIQFRDGRILNARFRNYRVPRFSDVPEMEIVLLDRKDLPSAGAGETPMSALAPAIGNAIFSATGVRLRGLPMVPRDAMNQKSAPPAD